MDSAIGAVVFCAMVAAFSLLIIGLGKILPSSRDDTDPPDGVSGMSLHTDHKTGCQYVAKGGITPRLDGSGKHVGCKGQ